MFDAVEMMRKTWSGMNVPSSLQPTMDIGEIERRIADLRVVEQWLQLNQTMLQTTIQALEIQRNSVAAFQAFTKAGAMVASTPSPSAAVNPPVSPSVSPSAGPSPAIGPAADSPSSSSIAAAQAALWWDFLQQPFRQMTEAATRRPAVGSGDSPAPTAPRGKPQAANLPVSDPSSAQPTAEFERRTPTHSGSTPPVDERVTSHNGRSNSPKRSKD
jgi:hypothetical protein